MSTPTNNQATYFSDDKPTSRYIFRDNVTFNIAEIKPVIRRVA